MVRFDAIIKSFGYARLSALLSVPYGTVTSWKARNFIPPRFWSALVDEAARLQIDGVTLEALAQAEMSREHSAQGSKKVA